MAGKSNEQKTFMDIFKDPIALDEFLQAQCKASTEDPFADFNCDTSKAKAKGESNEPQKEMPTSAGATFEDRLPDGPMFFMQQNVNINNEQASTTSRQQKGMHPSTENYRNGIIKTEGPSGNGGGTGNNTTVLSQMIGAQTNINVIVNQTIFDRNQQKAADMRAVTAYDNRRQAKCGTVAPPLPRMEVPTPKRKQRAANITLQHLIGQNAAPPTNAKRQRNSTRRTAKAAPLTDPPPHQLPIVTQARDVYNTNQRQSMQALMMFASPDQLDNRASALNQQGVVDQKRTADIPVEYLWPLLRQSVRPTTVAKDQQPVFLVGPQLNQRQPLPRLPNAVAAKQRQCRPVVREHNFTNDERLRLAQQRALKNFQNASMQVKCSQPSYSAVPPSYLRGENGIRLTEPMQQTFTAHSLNRIPPIPVQQCTRISPELSRTVNVLYSADPQFDASKLQAKPLNEQYFRPQAVIPQMQRHRLPRQLVSNGPTQPGCRSDSKLLPNVPAVKRSVHFQDDFVQPVVPPVNRISLAQAKQAQEEAKRLAAEREKAEQLRREEELRKRLERDKYLYEHPDLETPFSNYNDITERLTPFITMAPDDNGAPVCAPSAHGIDLASEVERLKERCCRIVNSKSKTSSTPKDAADRLLVFNLLLEMERQSLSELRAAPPSLPEHVLKLRGRSKCLPVHCRFHVDAVERRKSAHAPVYTEERIPMPAAAPSEYGSDDEQSSENPLRGLPPL